MRIGIAGCAGRMGRMLVRAVLDAPEACLVAGCERPGHPSLGVDVGVLAGAAAIGVSVGADAEEVFTLADAVIDFSMPEATTAHARLAATHRVALVAGTTGLGEPQHAALADAARLTPVVQAANMSVGVNLLLALTRQVAALLGPDYDIEIVEMHHRHKVDAPSGTALALGAAAADGRRVALPAAAIRSRDGITGARPAGAIGFATLRGGDVVGEHTVIFAGEGERIELTHKASSRQVFAAGAVRAALWTAGRPPGLYGMRDVLGIG
jgi:4-hydroxy-tetrahydrodipicolinate reductase